MLKSKFMKNNCNFRAQKLFTDRNGPKEVFRNSILSYIRKPQEIINYYGIGGIGKTTLLKNLISGSELCYKEVDMNIHNIIISLDAYDYSNPVNILMSIRNGIHGDCSLFDYALMQYCSKAKLTVEEIMNQNHFLSSPVMEILNEALNIGTANACIPTAIMKKFISVFKDIRLMEKYKSEIREMDSLNEFDIFERLPYYLGLCISHAAVKKNYHTLFLDSYESMLKRTISTTPSVENEDWLKELFLSSSYIRIVIASRDKLGWENEDSDWVNFLNSHLLSTLSKNDCKWFLHNVPISNETIINEIAARSGGVPLYLDMCVDIYEDSINGGKDFDFMTLEKGEKIIDRYIRHLDKKDKYAVKVLSVLRSFGVTFAVELLKRQNLLYSTEEFETLLEKSIFIPVESATQLWKVDESVRIHLSQRMKLEKKREIIDSVLGCILDGTYSRMFSYFATVIDQIMDNPELIFGEEEKVFELIDHYANSGYWNELHMLLSDSGNSQNDTVKMIGIYEEIVWNRRTGQLHNAQMMIEHSKINCEKMGVWFYMYRYLTIQIKHLLGFYDESIIAYKSLLDEMELIKSELPVHIYTIVSMKYADLLFLKGEFQQSLDIVNNLLDDNFTRIDDKIELIRIKGHIYRFQHKYESAEVIYKSGLKLIAGLKMVAYEGKLYTNMAETLCMIRPSESLEWYEKALECNDAIGNDIELGKAKAAASVANANLGLYNQAISLGIESIAVAERTGYKSGKVFVFAALKYVYKSMGNDEMSSIYKEKLKNLIEEINVYRYLCEE